MTLAGGHVLPVRPIPAKGEAFNSFATRVAEANGISPSTFTSSYRAGPSPHQTLALAQALDASESTLAGLTLKGLPPSITGRGPRRRTGWALHASVAWGCPRCTPTTGVTAKEWSLAYHPICTTCEVLLTEHNSDSQQPAPQSLIALVSQLSCLAQDAPRSYAARRRLGRYRVMCATIAATIDDTWPPRPPDAPRLNLASARSWGAHPSSDPPTVAAILLAASPTLHSPTARHRLMTTALNREHEPVRAADESQTAEGEAFARAAAPRANTRGNQTRLRELEAELRDLHRRHGLHPNHVPATLRVRQYAHRPGRERESEAAALGLHVLLTRTLGLPESITVTHRAFGSHGKAQLALVEAIVSRRGMTDESAQALHLATLLLIREGLIDYQSRRDMLRPLTRIRHSRSGPPLPSHQGRSGALLGAGWIWTRLTHGPMHTSGMPLVPDSAITSFDRLIDPEARLALLDHGHLRLSHATETTPLIPACADSKAEESA